MWFLDSPVWVGMWTSSFVCLVMVISRDWLTVICLLGNNHMIATVLCDSLIRPLPRVSEVSGTSILKAQSAAVLCLSANWYFVLSQMMVLWGGSAVSVLIALAYWQTPLVSLMWKSMASLQHTVLLVVRFKVFVHASGVCHLFALCFWQKLRVVHSLLLIEQDVSWICVNLVRVNFLNRWQETVCFKCCTILVLVSSRNQTLSDFQ